MTSSTEADLVPLATPELRGGDWTRYAGGGALGDRVTEQTLSALADRALEAARARGYSTGWTQGRRQAATEASAAAVEAAAEAALAESRRRVEHDAAMQALAAAARELQEATAAVAARLEEHCLDLALELTRAVVGHQLRTSPDPTGDLRTRVLAALPVLPDGVPVTVRAHPSRAGGLRDLLSELGISVVEDGALAPVDAVVETDTTVVDLGVDAALARVAQVLS